jgi:hypothetical protein
MKRIIVFHNLFLLENELTRERNQLISKYDQKHEKTKQDEENKKEKLFEFNDKRYLFIY